MNETGTIARLSSLTPPSNKRKPWRVFGPGEHYEDRPSENKAYELVRELFAAGETVTVYQWEYGRWFLYEHFEAGEGLTR